MSYNPLPIWDKFRDEQMDRYERMLWYQRSPGPDTIRQQYKDLSEERIQSILSHQVEIAEKYPEMVEKYEANPDFQHGYVSGTIAMMRLVEGIFNAEDYHDEEEDIVIPCNETAEWAVEEWPMLDS